MKKSRTDLRCPVEGHHVVCKLTSHGWACTLCGKIITKPEIDRQLKQVKEAKRGQDQKR